MLAVDVNGDGDPDVVIGGTSLSVALGHGDGTLGSEIDTPLNSLLLQGLVAGDFNGDGKLDIIGASGGADEIGGAYLSLGNGDGTFQTPTTLSTQTLTAVAKADFNGDGKPDVVLLSPGSSTSEGKLILLLGNGNGTFRAPVNLSFGKFYLDALCLGDLNGDGIPDIIVSGGSVPEELPLYGQLPTPGNAYVSVLLGNGDGTFAQPVTYEVNQPSAVSSGIAAGLVAADLNGTRDLDVVLSVFTYLYTFNGNGDGTLVQQSGEIPVSNANSVITGRVTNTPKPDILLGADAYSFTNNSELTSSVWILLNQ